MKIKVINPNTTFSMTRKIGTAAQSIASASTKVVATNPKEGVVSIEGYTDEAISTIGVLEEIRTGDQENFDAYVIACFGDPGLLAAREYTDKPVIGIAEAAMRAATFITNGFSIITTLARTKNIAQHLVFNYGMQNYCKKIRATELEVLSLEDHKSNAYKSILEECQIAIREDECGAIILGCAGMADLTERLSNDLKIAVIDGVSAAVVFCEALVKLKLGTSKTNDLAYPLTKKYTGPFAPLSPK